jgi:8-oxo-dGTP pyrophosphatase MutT (NUDIX family)
MTILGLPKKKVYDRGNGSAILLSTKQKTVILTRQFRLPTYLNGNKTGMMIEVCAGMLDQDNAEQCVIRTEEETGYRLTTVHKIMETYICLRA